MLTEEYKLLCRPPASTRVVFCPGPRGPPYLGLRRAGRPLGLDEEWRGGGAGRLEADERLPGGLGLLPRRLEELLPRGFGGAKRGGGHLHSTLDIQSIYSIAFC